jgi:hypothetical protein
MSNEGTTGSSITNEMTDAFCRAVPTTRSPGTVRSCAVAYASSDCSWAWTAPRSIAPR